MVKSFRDRKRGGGGDNGPSSSENNSNNNNNPQPEKSMGGASGKGGEAGEKRGGRDRGSERRKGGGDREASNTGGVEVGGGRRRRGGAGGGKREQEQFAVANATSNSNVGVGGSNDGNGEKRKRGEAGDKPKRSSRRRDRERDKHVEEVGGGRGKGGRGGAGEGGRTRKERDNFRAKERERNRLRKSTRKIGVPATSANLRTKVIVRRIPFWISEAVFFLTAQPYCTNVNYFQFVPAAPDYLDGWEGSRQLLGDAIASWSRCYLNFNTPEDAKTFWAEYDGFVFLDRNGNEYPVVVEYAPFDRLPRYFSCLPVYLRKEEVQPDVEETASVPSVDAAVGDQETNPDKEKAKATGNEGEMMRVPEVGGKSSVEAPNARAKATSCATGGDEMYNYLVDRCKISLRRKRHLLENTIEDDKSYIDFMELLNEPGEALPSAEVQLEKSEIAANSEKTGGIIKSDFQTTPLLEFLKKMKPHHMSKGGKKKAGRDQEKKKKGSSSKDAGDRKKKSKKEDRRKKDVAGEGEKRSNSGKKGKREKKSKEIDSQAFAKGLEIARRIAQGDSNASANSKPKQQQRGGSGKRGGNNSNKKAVEKSSPAVNVKGIAKRPDEGTSKGGSQNDRPCSGQQSKERKKQYGGNRAGE